jgi:hypothetical protein
MHQHQRLRSTPFALNDFRFDGVLTYGQGVALMNNLSHALAKANRSQYRVAGNIANAFINQERASRCCAGSATPMNRRPNGTRGIHPCRGGTRPSAVSHHLRSGAPYAGADTTTLMVKEPWVRNDSLGGEAVKHEIVKVTRHSHAAQTVEGRCCRRVSGLPRKVFLHRTECVSNLFARPRIFAAKGDKATARIGKVAARTGVPR